MDNENSPGYLIDTWPIELGVLRRTLTLWFVGRLVMVALLLLARAHPIVMHPRAALLFALAVGTLSFLETRRRNEELLLANLGTSRWLVRLLQFGPALGLEFLIAVVGRV